MEFLGTKGKWEYSPGDNNSVDIVLPNESTVSIDRSGRYSGVHVMEREEMEANALLISKAPEMLQILKDTYLQIYAVGSRMSNDNDSKQGLIGRAEQIKKLIQEATELK